MIDFFPRFLHHFGFLSGDFGRAISLTGLSLHECTNYCAWYQRSVPKIAGSIQNQYDRQTKFRHAAKFARSQWHGKMNCWYFKCKASLQGQWKGITYRNLCMKLSVNSHSLCELFTRAIPLIIAENRLMSSFFCFASKSLLDAPLRITREKEMRTFLAFIALSSHEAQIQSIFLSGGRLSLSSIQRVNFSFSLA